MPNVTAPSRLMGNGDVVTQFVDSVDTTAVTYTYPKTQEKLVVRNNGSSSLSVTVAGTTQVIAKGEKWENSAEFTTFSINAVSGSTSFDAWADEKGSTFDTPEGKYFGTLGASGGGSSSSASTSYGNTVVPFGDSITIGVGTGAPLNNVDISWATHAMLLSKGRFNVIYNAGISGNNTTQMLARIQTDVIAKSPKICVIFGGTNDVLQGVAITTTRSNIETMITTLMSNNITPILVAIPPADITANQSKNDNVNMVIRALAEKYRLHVADFHTPLVLNGLMNPAYSGDNVHPTAAGSKLLGQKFVDTIVPMLPNYTVHLPYANNTTGNLISNGLFLLDTNADGTPDNWTKSGTGTGTVSLITGDANIQGNWLEINKTVNDANAITVTSAAGTVAAGNKVVIMGRVQTVGAEAGGLTYSVSLGKNSGGSSYPLYQFTRDTDGVFYAEFNPVPAGVSLINVGLTALSGTGKVRLAQVAMYNLTTLGFS